MISDVNRPPARRQGPRAARLRIPARGLIGFQSDFLTMTRGTGVMSHVFDDYGPMKPEIAERRNGVLVSAEDGEAVAYALWKLQERGRMFVRPRRAALRRHDRRHCTAATTISS